MTWRITMKKIAQKYKKKHSVAFFSSFEITHREKTWFKFIATMSIFAEKWFLFSRSIISENMKDTEKLIRNKIFVFTKVYVCLSVCL